MTVKSMHNSAPRSFKTIEDAYSYLADVYGELPDHYHATVVELSRTLANVWVCERAKLEPGSKEWKAVQDVARGHAKHAEKLTAELNNALAGGDRRTGVKERAAMAADRGAPDTPLGAATEKLRKLREGDAEKA